LRDCLLFSVIIVCVAFLVYFSGSRFLNQNYITFLLVDRFKWVSLLRE
jgi:hypothetical protein